MKYNLYTIAYDTICCANAEAIISAKSMKNSIRMLEKEITKKAPNEKLKNLRINETEFKSDKKGILYKSYPLSRYYR